MPDTIRAYDYRDGPNDPASALSELNIRAENDITYFNGLEHRPLVVPSSGGGGGGETFVIRTFQAFPDPAPTGHATTTTLPASPNSVALAEWQDLIVIFQTSNRRIIRQYPIAAINVLPAGNSTIDEIGELTASNRIYVAYNTTTRQLVATRTAGGIQIAYIAVRR